MTIITSRYRHGFGRALALLQVKGCRCTGSVLGWIGVDGGVLVCNQHFSKKLLRALFFFRTSVRDSSSSSSDGTAAFLAAPKFCLFQ